MNEQQETLGMGSQFCSTTLQQKIFFSKSDTIENNVQNTVVSTQGAKAEIKVANDYQVTDFGNQKKC